MDLCFIINILGMTSKSNNLVADAVIEKISTIKHLTSHIVNQNWLQKMIY